MKKILKPTIIIIGYLLIIIGIFVPFYVNKASTALLVDPASFEIIIISSLLYYSYFAMFKNLGINISSFIKSITTNILQIGSLVGIFIGVLLGVTQFISNLDDYTAIGPGIAFTVISLLYGTFYIIILLNIKSSIQLNKDFDNNYSVDIGLYFLFLIPLILIILVMYLNLFFITIDEIFHWEYFLSVILIITGSFLSGKKYKLINYWNNCAVDSDKTSIIISNLNDLIVISIFSGILTATIFCLINIPESFPFNIFNFLGSILLIITYGIVFGFLIFMPMKMKFK